MSWGEESREPIDHTVTCVRCEKKFDYWNCVKADDGFVCEYCSITEEKREGERQQAIAGKSFKCEMERLSRIY